MMRGFVAVAVMICMMFPRLTDAQVLLPMDGGAMVAICRATTPDAARLKCYDDAWRPTVGNASTKATNPPLSVKDILLDGELMIGKSVSVRGSPQCMGQSFCFLRDGATDFMTNLQFDASSLNRESRKHLLDCSNALQFCSVVLSGIVSKYMGGISVKATSLDW